MIVVVGVTDDGMLLVPSNQIIDVHIFDCILSSREKEIKSTCVYQCSCFPSRYSHAYLPETVKFVMIYVKLDSGKN